MQQQSLNPSLFKLAIVTFFHISGTLSLTWPTSTSFLTLFTNICLIAMQFQDLIATDATGFATEANLWTANSLMNTGVYSSPCGSTYILGGYNILGSTSSSYSNYFNRAYTSLPSHQSLQASLTLYLLDNWVSTDYLNIMFDLVSFKSWAYTSTSSTNYLCGSPTYADFPPINAYMTVVHSATTLNLKLLSRVSGVSTAKSFGIRNIKVTFSTSSVSSSTICGTSSVALNIQPCPCGTAQYMSPSNSGMCYPCDPSCSTCSGGDSNQCTSCSPATNYVANGTCVNTCPSPPLIRNFVPRRCTTPCPLQYAYWDASCSATCDSPLQVQTINTFDLCTFPCGSGYLYWNGTCDSSCDSPLSSRVWLLKKFCDFPCADTDFLYLDGTCSSQCPLPYIQQIEGTPSRNFCINPCGSNAYLYWDGTCYSLCNFPLQRNLHNSQYYCIYPCSSTEFLYWNGSCLANCDSPYITRISFGAQFCDYPCSATQFNCWNGTCLDDCHSPLQQNLMYGYQSCEFRCHSQKYLYWNGGCEVGCPTPLSQVVIGGDSPRNTCIFPCSTTDYLYLDGTCASTCNFPLVNNIIKNRHFCIYPCNNAQYLYWNGSCLASCDSPLTERIEAGLNYCDNPCSSISEYLYWNGSCIGSCLYPLVQSVIASDLYCIFSCADTEILYWDGTCSNQCDSPRTLAIEGSLMIRSFCLYPCTSSEYLYWNETCASNCPFPLTHTSSNSRNFCYYPCDINKYLYWNGSCLDICAPSLPLRVEASRNYCDYPCADAEYLYWNGSCLSNCSFPLEHRLEAGKNYCDFPCSDTDYLYWDQSCSGSCDSPLTQHSEGSSLIRNFCTFKCSTTEFLYWNGTCSSNCYFPLSQEIHNSRNFCIYPCSITDNLYYNGSCISICNSPLEYRLEASRNYCDYPCIGPNQYLWWNRSCLSVCPFQLNIVTLNSRNWCVYPCSSTETLYYDGSCLPYCEAPLSILSYTSYSMCDSKCINGQYLYPNGTCNSQCGSRFNFNVRFDRYFCDFKCPAPYYYYPTSSGCVTTCPVGFYGEDVTRYCEACQDSLCLSCPINLNGRCVKCQAGSILDSDGVCKGKIILYVSSNLLLVCKTMDTQYVSAVANNKHEYLIELGPASCDLALTTVSSLLASTQASRNALPSFTMKVASKMTNNVYVVDVTLGASLLNPTNLDVTLSDVDGSLAIPRTFVISPSLKSVAQYAPSPSSITNSNFATVFVIMATFILWPMNTFQQFIGFFIYLNTVFPPQVELFLSIFAFTNWNFLPNPLAFLTVSLNNDILQLTGTPESKLKYQPPPKFEKFERTSFFIDTGTPVLTLNFILLILITSLRIARKFTKLKKFKILHWIYINIRWNFIFRLFLENGAQLALSTFLQLRKFSLINAYTVISVGLSVISLIYIVFMAQFILGTLQDRDPEHLKSSKIRRLYSTLYENIALENSASKYYHTMMFFRSMLITFMISFVESLPYLQIVPLIAFNTVLVYYLFFHASFENSKFNKINRMKEVLILIAEVLIFCINFEGKSEQYYSTLGWFIIGLLCFAVVTEFIYTIVKQINILRTMIGNRKQHLSDLKEVLSDYLGFARTISNFFRRIFGMNNKRVGKNLKNSGPYSQSQMYDKAGNIQTENRMVPEERTDMQIIEEMINNLQDEQQVDDQENFNKQNEMQAIENIIKNLQLEPQVEDKIVDDNIKIENIDEDSEKMSSGPKLDASIRKKYFDEKAIDGRTIDDIEINTTSFSISKSNTMNSNSSNFSLLKSDSQKLSPKDNSLKLQQVENKNDVVVVDLDDENKI